MKEKVYHLRIYSISRYLIALTVTLCLSLILLEDFLRGTENKFISILEFLAIFLTSAFVANQLETAKVAGATTKEEVNANLIKDLRILFDADDNIKDRIQKTKVNPVA